MLMGRLEEPPGRTRRTKKGTKGAGRWVVVSLGFHPVEYKSYCCIIIYHAEKCVLEGGFEAHKLCHQELRVKVIIE